MDIFVKLYRIWVQLEFFFKLVSSISYVMQKLIKCYEKGLFLQNMLYEVIFCQYVNYVYFLEVRDFYKGKEFVMYFCFRKWFIRYIFIYFVMSD